MIHDNDFDNEMFSIYPNVLYGLQKKALSKMICLSTMNNPNVKIHSYNIQTHFPGSTSVFTANTLICFLSIEKGFEAVILVLERES